MVALLVAAALTGAPPADAQQRGTPLRVHVRGSAKIDAVAWSEPDAFMVRGHLIDDARSPLAKATITVQATTAGGARVELPQASPCRALGSGDGGGYRASAEGYAVETDENGSFCLRGRTPLRQATIRIRFPGSQLYEAAQADVVLEDLHSAVAPTILRLDPALDGIDLDRASINVAVALRIDRSADRSHGGAPVPRDGLTVSLEDERGTKLGEATTGGDGRARFELKTAALGGPGLGELRARFEGTAILARALVGQPLVRYAQATLALSHPLEPARTDDGVPIDVDVRSARGPVEGGVVEALRAGEGVGVAAVAGGKARVIVSVASERAGTVPLTLRYVPAAPWWRPGAELAIDVPVAGPGVWRQIALGALVLAIAGWVLVGWRRAPKRTHAPAREAKVAPLPGRPGVHVIGPSEGATGWRGHVTDAHDGTPIANAEITILVPVFALAHDATEAARFSVGGAPGVIARAVTDAAGAFTLQGAQQTDARLMVRASTHSSHEQALPPPSTLSVALVTRRRTLLDRLVRWARRQGAPFEGPPEPTPGHVRRTAVREQQAEVELWATRIEQAAFGPDAVDERLEQELSAAEPKPGVPRPTG